MYAYSAPDPFCSCSMGATTLIGQSSLRRADSVVTDPGSPSRILQRLTSASYRPSAAGLLTAADLEAAAEKARRALRTSLDCGGTVWEREEDESREADQLEAGRGGKGVCVDAKPSTELGADTKPRLGSAGRTGPVIVVHASTPGAASKSVRMFGGVGPGALTAVKEYHQAVEAQRGGNIPGRSIAALPNEGVKVCGVSYIFARQCLMRWTSPELP